MDWAARLRLMTRRKFLGQTLGAGGALFVRCSGSGSGNAKTLDGGTSDSGLDAPPNPSCDDPFAGGTLAGMVAFTNDGASVLNEPFNQGLDGRLYTDLSTLSEDTLTTPTDHFYIRTRASDLLDVKQPWNIVIDGLVATPTTAALSDLLGKVVKQPATLLECSGNGAGANFGLMSSAQWSGVPLSHLYKLVDVMPTATRVLVSGFDEYSVLSLNSVPGASWIFTFDDIDRAGAALVTEMNGMPLPVDHGFPVRLLMPGWYGCCNIKWVNNIRFVDEDEPSTVHMREFASRTHQNGKPALARDFIPATMDQAAMPIRVERWTVGGKTLFKVVGIMWGGYQVTDNLVIHFNADEQFVPVDVCPAQTTNRTWTLWSHAWAPGGAGTYNIALKIDDPKIPQRRLDTGFYIRSVVIDEV